MKNFSLEEEKKTRFHDWRLSTFSGAENKVLKNNFFSKFFQIKNHFFKTLFSVPEKVENRQMGNREKFLPDLFFPRDFFFPKQNGLGGF